MSPRSRTIVVSGQIRIRVDPIEHNGQTIDARTLAAAARQWIHQQLGVARVKLQTPKNGRGEGDGIVPAFAYGTFDFPFELTVPARATATRAPRPLLDDRVYYGEDDTAVECEGHYAQDEEAERKIMSEHRDVLGSASGPAVPACCRTVDIVLNVDTADDTRGREDLPS